VYFLNSAVVTLGSVFYPTHLWRPTRSRASAASSRPLFAFFVAGLLGGAAGLMVPLYVIVDTLGLVDSLLGIILVSISFQLPVAVLILTGLCSLPKDLPDAAFIDGATGVGHLSELCTKTT